MDKKKLFLLIFFLTFTMPPVSSMELDCALINKTVIVDLTPFGRPEEFKSYTYGEYNNARDCPLFFRGYRTKQKINVPNINFTLCEDGSCATIKFRANTSGVIQKDWVNETSLITTDKPAWELIYKTARVDMTQYGLPGEFKEYEYGECYRSRQRITPTIIDPWWPVEYPSTTTSERPIFKGQIMSINEIELGEIYIMKHTRYGGEIELRIVRLTDDGWFYSDKYELESLNHHSLADHGVIPYDFGKWNCCNYMVKKRSN